MTGDVTNPAAVDSWGSRLAATALVVTVAAVSLEFTGLLVAGVVLTLGLLAVAARARTAPLAQAAVLGPYVLVVALKLAADVARYNLDYPAQLGAAVAWASGPLDGRTYFIYLVVAPVSVMLFGGYLLGRGHQGALIAVWWTALVGAADGLTYLALSPGTEGQEPVLVLAAVAATLCQVVAVAVLVQRLLRPHTRIRKPSADGGLSGRQRALWTLLFVAVVSVYAVTVQAQSGNLPVGVIIGSMVGGLIGWWITTSKAPADPATHTPLLLLLLALFYVHVGEEAVTHFNRGIAGVSGTPWSDNDFTTLIGLLGPAVWVLAAWSLWQRQPFGNFVLWFLIVGMILGEPTHLLVFPVMRMAQEGVGYGYFSGMYTALFPMIPAILMLRSIVHQHRRRDGAPRKGAGS